MKPKISVIVLVHNAEGTLRQELEKLPQEESTQIILLDDGSTDNSWQIALDWWDNRRVQCNGSIIHRWEEKHGLNKTLQLGNKLARGNCMSLCVVKEYK